MKRNRYEVKVYQGLLSRGSFLGMGRGQWTSLIIGSCLALLILYAVEATVVTTLATLIGVIGFGGILLRELKIEALGDLGRFSGLVSGDPEEFASHEEIRR